MSRGNTHMTDVSFISASRGARRPWGAVILTELPLSCEKDVLPFVKGADFQESLFSMLRARCVRFSHEKYCVP